LKEEIMKRLFQLGLAVFGMSILSAGCGGTDGTGGGGPAPVTYNGGGTKLLEGTCEGRNHACKGNAALFRTDTGAVELRLASNFQVVDIPGGFVYLSARDALGSGSTAIRPETESDLGALARFSGAQNYSVAQGQDDGKTYAWIWCRPYAVEVARFELKTPAQ
jgi:hypothetical protein